MARFFLSIIKMMIYLSCFLQTFFYDLQFLKIDWHWLLLNVKYCLMIYYPCFIGKKFPDIKDRLKVRKKCIVLLGTGFIRSSNFSALALRSTTHLSKLWVTYSRSSSESSLKMLFCEIKHFKQCHNICEITIAILSLSI